MKIKNTLTSDLEILVENLASNIQDYPNTDKRKIYRLADRLDKQIEFGQKQKIKTRILEKLGYEIENYPMHASLPTIAENIVYFTKLGVKDIKRLVNKLPQALELDVEEKIKPRIEYLISIGVKRKDMNAVLYRFPNFLCLDLKKKIIPRIDYFKSLGIKEKNIGKIITNCPSILSFNIENTMKPRVDYLESLGLKKNEIGKILTAKPNILEYHVERKLKPAVNYLKEIGINRKQIKSILIRLPQVLGLSIENNLKPTYDYLSENFKIKSEDIIRTPTLLAHSLERKIKPRYEFLKLKGLENHYTASSVLIGDDKRFIKLISRCPLVQESFSSLLIEYLSSKDKK